MVYRAKDVQTGKAAWCAGLRNGYQLKGYLVRPTTKRADSKMTTWSSDAIKNLRALSDKHKKDVIAVRIHGGDNPVWQGGIWKRREDAITKVKVCRSHGYERSRPHGYVILTPICMNQYQIRKEDPDVARRRIRDAIRLQDIQIQEAMNLGCVESDQDNTEDERPPVGKKSRAILSDSEESSERPFGSSDESSDEETDAIRQLHDRTGPPDGPPRTHSKSKSVGFRGATAAASIDRSTNPESSRDAEMGQASSSTAGINHNPESSRDTEMGQASSSATDTSSPQPISVVNEDPQPSSVEQVESREEIDSASPASTGAAAVRPVPNLPSLSKQSTKKNRKRMLDGFDLLDIDASLLLDADATIIDHAPSSSQTSTESTHLCSPQNIYRGSVQNHLESRSAHCRIIIQSPVLELFSPTGSSHKYVLKPTCFSPCKPLSEEAIVLICSQAAQFVRPELLMLAPPMLFEGGVKIELPSPPPPLLCIPVKYFEDGKLSWTLIAITTKNGISTIFEFSTSGHLSSIGFAFGSAMLSSKIALQGGNTRPVEQAEDSALSTVSSFIAVVKAAICDPDNISGFITKTKIAILDRPDIQRCIQAIMGDIILGDNLCWGQRGNVIYPCKIMTEALAKLVMTDPSLHCGSVAIMWFGENNSIEWVKREGLEPLNRMDLHEALRKQSITPDEMKSITRAFEIATGAAAI